MTFNNNKMNNTRYLITLKAEDRPGLLHLVTGILNRKLIRIVSLTAAPTDIHDIVLITMEIDIPKKAVQSLLYKLGNIIEIFASEATPLENALCQRAAYFKMDKAVLASKQALVIRKWDAQIVNLHPGTVLISKLGTEAVIRSLYNALEGPYLLGFSQTGLITDTCLMAKDDSSVISTLAA